MVYVLAYRRPPHVSLTSLSSISGIDKLSTADSRSGPYVPYGIPDALSFDRVISGGTCPPCTARDFMNYLVYIEHAAENLQFFLWFRDYSRRFAKLPATETALSPEWTHDKAEVELPKEAPVTQLPISPEAAAAFRGTDFAPPKTTVREYNPYANPFNDLPATSDGTSSVRPSTNGPDSDARSMAPSSQKTDYSRQAASAFETADVKWQPFTIQPFREEITRVIATYITDNGPRQLNLASKERVALLRALALTTHPSAFSRVVHTVEWSLRHQAHPNFIRWTICNGNRPRTIFARAFGCTAIALGLTAAALLTASGVSRAWRVLALVPLILGIATLFAGWKGLCVVLHGMHHRHLRPWELFAPSANADDEADSVYELKRAKASLDELAQHAGFAGAGNSYEDEPWVVRYEQRSTLRKVFDREVWIQEPALRNIQDTIFAQALIVGLIGSLILVGAFAAIPPGRRF